MKSWRARIGSCWKAMPKVVRVFIARGLLFGILLGIFLHFSEGLMLSVDLDLDVYIMAWCYKWRDIVATGLLAAGYVGSIIYDMSRVR